METPNYYKGKVYGYEAHEVIEDFAGDNYNIGVAIAYLLRAGKKENNDIKQELNKAIDHLKFELKRQNNAEKLRGDNKGTKRLREDNNIPFNYSWTAKTPRKG
jgi:hypothetical protein